MGHIDPTKDVFAQFRANDRPGPIHMLNLVRLRPQAAYPDGRNSTGAEAYAAYGRESGPVFERLGGRIVWQGRFELMLIGPQEERWDHCFIAEYPSVAAFVEMIRDPVYREAVKHRQAAVEDSRLIRLGVLPAGKKARLVNLNVRADAGQLREELVPYDPPPRGEAEFAVECAGADVGQQGRNMQRGSSIAGDLDMVQPGAVADDQLEHGVDLVVRLVGPLIRLDQRNARATADLDP